MESTFQHVQMAAEGKIQLNFIDITSVPAIIAPRIQCLAPKQATVAGKTGF